MVSNGQRGVRLDTYSFGGKHLQTGLRLPPWYIDLLINQKAGFEIIIAFLSGVLSLSLFFFAFVLCFVVLLVGLSTGLGSEFVSCCKSLFPFLFPPSFVRIVGSYKKNSQGNLF